MQTVRAVTANGIRLRCRFIGDPDLPPMLLLHALGQSASAWEPVTAALAARFRLYVPDLRGHGGSDWPGEYSFGLLRDDVLGLIDCLGLHEVVLAGHSMGGVAAYLAAIAVPDRVRRLVIEDVVPPYVRDRPVPIRPADEQLDFDWAVVPAIVGEVNAGSPQAWAALPTISAPTLIIGGGPESHIPQEKLAEAAAIIPRCDLVTIPVGHHVHESRPAEFCEMVLRWLGSGGPNTQPAQPGPD